MRRLFITGESGFVGRAFDRLRAHAVAQYGWELVSAGGAYDLQDADSLDRVLNHARPDAVIHLDRQDVAAEVLSDPVDTEDINLQGTLMLLQSLQRTGFNGSFLYVSSSEVYGPVDPAVLPITELQALHPQNQYAVSKVAAELLCHQWSRKLPWRIMTARPFKHIGTGQREDFVIASVARQMARIKLGLQAPRIVVGDIDQSHDFLDVEDVISAYLALLATGRMAKSTTSAQARNT
ncbi:NAD dependent epimerase/dehydratase family protein [Collimonas arenae]|uniref:NAD-dependent epimerase/dehydratase family protein n=1 Tax=Collimonas arenae TaxID=279058 RepID=UPI00078EC6CE|nr:NAD-dependent epimerase/dehydratase family protein [Collimonas arenae]AMP01153.1 NAD dependent epimerase/dehydratase family protein [Collimonas arenae]